MRELGSCHLIHGIAGSIDKLIEILSKHSSYESTSKILLKG